MTASAGFLYYAALYRLTVLTVGVLSILLGFRLLSDASKGNSPIEKQEKKCIFAKSCGRSSM